MRQLCKSCSIGKLAPSQLRFSGLVDKDEILPAAEASILQSCLEGDSKYACRRSKQPNVAAICCTTASSCSAGDVTSVMMLKEVNACPVVSGTVPLILAWTANIVKVITGT